MTATNVKNNKAFQFTLHLPLCVLHRFLMNTNIWSVPIAIHAAIEKWPQVIWLLLSKLLSGMSSAAMYLCSFSKSRFGVPVWSFLAAAIALQLLLTAPTQLKMTPPGFDLDGLFTWRRPGLPNAHMHLLTFCLLTFLDIIVTAYTFKCSYRAPTPPVPTIWLAWPNDSWQL